MKVKKIAGDIHIDSRGKLEYINDMNFSKVKRFYKITPASTNIIRAWQVHKVESKWFHCIKGRFEVKIVNLKTNEIKTYILKDYEMKILFIPKNHANGFKALEKDSCLQIFSDKNLGESIMDGEMLGIGSFDESWK